MNNAQTPHQADRFAGRTVVVTGAAAGIGRAAAVQLLAEGAVVVAADVAPLDELVARGGDRVRPVVGNLLDDEVLDQVLQAGAGEIDAVAHVVGITDGWLPPAEIDDDTWSRVLELNLTLPMRLTRAVLPQMIERGRGQHVYVSSEASFRASLSGAAYTTSKHGLNGFVKSVAYYYGRQGIQANAIAPGGVLTGMDTAFRSAYAQSVTTPALADHLRPASVEPEVIVSSLLWLLSGQAHNVNGAIVPVDGGWSTQ